MSVWTPPPGLTPGTPQGRNENDLEMVYPMSHGLVMRRPAVDRKASITLREVLSLNALRTHAIEAVQRRSGLHRRNTRLCLSRGFWRAGRDEYTDHWRQTARLLSRTEQAAALPVTPIRPWRWPAQALSSSRRCIPAITIRRTAPSAQRAGFPIARGTSSASPTIC